MPAIYTLVDSSTSITGSWADLGGEIAVDGHKDLALWIKLLINEANNVQFRALACHTSGGDRFQLMEHTYATGVYTEDTVVHEMNSDSDQNIMFHIHLEGDTPFVQIQGRALTPGEINATVEEIKYDSI